MGATVVTTRIVFFGSAAWVTLESRNGNNADRRKGLMSLMKNRVINPFMVVPTGTEYRCASLALLRKYEKI
jgi:hypothetical protein